MPFEEKKVFLKHNNIHNVSLPKLWTELKWLFWLCFYKNQDTISDFSIKISYWLQIQRIEWQILDADLNLKKTKRPKFSHSKIKALVSENSWETLDTNCGWLRRILSFGHVRFWVQRIFGRLKKTQFEITWIKKKPF